MALPSVRKRRSVLLRLMCSTKRWHTVLVLFFATQMSSASMATVQRPLLLVWLIEAGFEVLSESWARVHTTELLQPEALPPLSSKLQIRTLLVLAGIMSMVLPLS